MKPPIPTELPIPAIMMRRAITANVLAAVDIKQRGAIKIAEDRWPHDRSTPMLLRAATSPADTTKCERICRQPGTAKRGSEVVC
jgi:hypothetical protein